MSADVDLLAIAPHPDDAELCCGGWLALAAERGQRAGILDLSRGELASNGDVVTRAREADAAAALLGLHFRDNLGLPDGGIAPICAQVEALVRYLRHRRPQLVLAPALQARHPDHSAAGELARRAVFFAGLARYGPDLGAPFRPSRLLLYPQRHEVRPDFVVDISAVVDRKAAAVAAHASQVGGANPTMIGRPLGVEAFEVRDRYWGASIGVHAAEPYLLGGPVPIADPIAHFAAHPDAPVLVPVR